MAEMIGPVHFRGKIGNLRYYYLKSAKKWVVAGNGGANKELILNNPAFVRTRENMSEFGACGTTASALRKALIELDHLNAGYYMGEVVKLMKIIQKKDIPGVPGHRNIFISRFKSLLTTINFNANHPFSQVLSHQIEVNADQNRNTIAVRIPDICSYYEISWPVTFDWYRISLVIAQQPDCRWSEEFGVYLSPYPMAHANSVTVRSVWLKRSRDTVDIDLTASFPDTKLPPDDVTVVVAVGIEIATNMVGNAFVSADGCGTMAIIACL